MRLTLTQPKVSQDISFDLKKQKMMYVDREITNFTNLIYYLTYAVQYLSKININHWKDTLPLQV